MDIQFPKGNYRADSSETTTFCSARQLKNHIELFSTFLDERQESQMYKLIKNPLNADQWNMYSCSHPVTNVYRKIITVIVTVRF